MLDEDNQDTSGRITIEDVRSAIGDINPNEINSGKIREIIGRGSNSTIQKHLMTIRNERSAANKQINPVDTPKPPEDAFLTIWSIALAAAQTQVLSRINQLSIERDLFSVTVATQEADIASLSERIDEAELKEKNLNNELVTAKNKSNELEAEIITIKAQLNSEVEKLKTSATLREDRENQEKIINEHKFQSREQAFKLTLGQLTDQLTELKSLHTIAASPLVVNVNKEMVSSTITTSNIEPALNIRI